MINTKKLTQQKKSAPAGFTLIELLVVIAIIGILASVVLISLNSARSKANTSKVEQEVRSFQVASALNFSETGSYPIPTNPGASCVGGVVTGFCCVSQGGCNYGGTILSTATFPSIFLAGDFLSPTLPRWISAFADVAYAAILSQLPSQPPLVIPGGINYQGVFYKCDNLASPTKCTAATIIWTQPTTECKKGGVHLSTVGVCQQDISGQGGGSGSGSTPEDCDNSLDDDNDGDTDCADSDCSGDPSCPTSENCSTSADEDGDNFGQCDDSDCFGGTYCTNETSNGASCSDGKDNDAGGGTDCADTDCASNSACGEICDNGIDDADTDTAIDCADTECDTASNCEGGGGNSECEDGIDNDTSGGTDCGDVGCHSAATCNDCSCETNTCNDYFFDDPCYPNGDPYNCDDNIPDDPCYPNGDPMNCGPGMDEPCETNNCSIANDSCETNNCSIANDPCYTSGNDPYNCQCW